MRMSDLVQKALHLNGKPFSIADYPYLTQLYNTPARELSLFTARQVSKSTFIASRMSTNALVNPGGKQLLVVPLQDQAYVFSMQRLADFTTGSPFMKAALCTGPAVVDQVLRKIFSNRHMITLTYAQASADRVRGQSITDNAILGFDEYQDIQEEVIPVVMELGFRARNVTYLRSGTPKSFSNHMEAVRARSTGHEWGVKCRAMGCGFWNYEWLEKNIGNAFICCARCGERLNTNDGQWIAARQIDVHKGRDAQVTGEGYRIPQLIVKPVMDDPYKYLELLTKLRIYSTAQFRNEVLGMPHDLGSQPITLDQLRACCLSDRINAFPPPGDPTTPALVMGVDWAFVAENSYTTVVIGGWSSFPNRVDVYYYKVFKGNESDSLYQVQWIADMVRQHNIRMVAADWGAGHVQNLQLANILGEERVLQLWHTGMRGGADRTRAKWDARTKKYHLSKTRVLTDTFEALRRREVKLPRAEECTEFFDHIMAEALEYVEETNRARYVHVKPDDALHALTFCMLGAELYLRGNFSGHLGSKMTTPGEDAMDDGAEADFVSDAPLVA
jgi:hypothetical protein